MREGPQRQPDGITHTRLYRPSKERGAIASFTETQARKAIAEKTDALKNNYDTRKDKEREREELAERLEAVQRKLPPDDFLGKLTGVLNKETREGWARAAGLKNQLATLDAAMTNLRERYNMIKGEIDDVVLGVVKEEAWWRKASTVERYVVQLKIDVRAYKKAADAARHRANGILAEKNEDSLVGTESNATEQRPVYIQELTLLLQQAYAAGDAFMKTFNDYYSAAEKPPPWKVEIPIGKNVRITLDLVQNKEVLSLYTPDSIHALEERLGFLSERLAAARKEITARLREIRTEKNKHFHRTKTRLSTHFA
ncbi:hypothetical protein HY622_01690 [Candidatus Uhrbacteria bacterium]|nr:hypothetical protein [Candidatus Uhrbacteria bacterium]